MSPDELLALAKEECIVYKVNLKTNEVEEHSKGTSKLISMEKFPSFDL